ncbi:unnamed protein product, partial [marine sediment metagenome]
REIRNQTDLDILKFLDGMGNIKNISNLKEINHADLTSQIEKPINTVKTLIIHQSHLYQKELEELEKLLQDKEIQKFFF